MDFTMNNSLVSIITPCHNSARYIRDCIESVEAQDYPYWEMLITDDGSTDNTTEIVEEYARKDDRIRLFRLNSASGSPAAPRNNSIRNARGKYIAFLDSDDVWMHNKLSDQIRFAEQNNYSVVYSYYEKISDSGERYDRVVRTDVSYDYNRIIKTDGVPWLTLMVERKIMEGLHFVKGEKEDYIFLMALLRRGYTAYNTCQMHALYRDTNASRSGNKLKMMYAQWKVIRKYESLSVIKALYCMAIYAFNGLKKHII